MISSPPTAALRVELVDRVAVLTLDLPNESVNKLTRGVIGELATAVEMLNSDRSIVGAVLIGGKKDIFIAGADIDEFLTVTSAADAERLSRTGHEMLQRLERLRIPLVAAIDGACLGGGLETVLACRYRIATDNPKTVLALPEVQLGLIPGAGGTQRLPRLVGLRTALDMILTGKNVRAKKALTLGLVDEVVHPAILRATAIARARDIAAGKYGRQPVGGGPLGALLDDNRFGRSIVLHQARVQTLAKTRGHYPAPLAAIAAIAAGYEGAESGMATEARLFGEMAATDVSKELIFLFFATTALKKDPGVAAPAPDAAPVSKLGVLGAGFMGSGIAAIAAQSGTLVRLKDADTSRVAKGLQAVREVLKDKLTRKQVTRQQFDDQMALVGGTTDYSGFANVDIVVEAVFEELPVKHQVVREVEPLLPERAIFASNTSTIPIGRIAKASARPDRVIGMHFFSPVPKMPLLEVIVTPETSREVVTTAVAFGKQLGKTVIVVNDGAGFYANRILSPYINEAGKMLDEGAPIDDVDRALVGFGFPVGPLTLVDEVGIDIAAKAGNIIADAFGERMTPSQSLQRVIGAGRLGRKGRKGFYLYDSSGKKGGVDPSVYQLLPTGAQRSHIPADEIVRRAVFAMLNEAARCLEEGIVRSPRDGDVGAVFGIGFPPFRGGPFRYMDSLGIDVVVRTLRDLDSTFAPRFQPAHLLVAMAERGERFYPVGSKPV
ncbi:MAG: fatty acid oxidation complex subunit alpha FadJ [Gemmatimonadaceae bacterium]